MNGRIKDIAQRLRALDPETSFIVQAPAGSGKTGLLMQRYLNLLATVQRPEEILALTFTRKAASEMHDRVVSALMAAKDGPPPEDAHDKKTYELAKKALERDSSLGWRVLGNPGRLKIQTLDSFSASLVRQMPLMSRMGSAPAVSGAPKELYAEAARRTALKVEAEDEEGESVRKALAHLDNSMAALTKRLVMMLERRDQWLRHIRKDLDNEELRGIVEGSLRELVEDGLRDALKRLPAQCLPRLAELSRYAAENIKDGSPVKMLAGLDAGALSDRGAQSLSVWKAISGLFVTSNGQWRKPGGVNINIGFPPAKDEPAVRRKEEFTELLRRFEGNGGLLEGFRLIGGLPEPKLDEDEWETLSALMHLLPISDGYLSEVFGEKGQVDFQAVALAAEASLGADDRPTDLMLSLDLRLRHILVDEYQDTSRTQLSLLRALTRGWTPGDGRTVFVVGDPMQSIYLFREAEVGLFLDARINGIGGLELEPITLETNFRSEARIVDWVNCSFKGAFPDEEDIFTGSIRYCASSAFKEPGKSGVKIFLYLGRDDLAEARKVLSIIRGIDKKESVAVLCRSRSHLVHVIGLLKAEGISFRAQDMDTLEDRAVIQDLLALFRAISHPYDRVAWLASLRAPWCGLGLKDLHSLCVNDADRPVLSLLCDKGRIGSLSRDGRERAERFTEKMKAALLLKGRVGMRGLVEGLWIGLGGPATVSDGAALKDAEAFFGLVSELDSSGGLGPARLEERLKGLYADHGGADDTNIDLMTVHKAKGLEFDHVIIPGTGRPPRGAEKKLVVWMERKDGLLLAPIEKKGGECGELYGYLSAIARRKGELEDTRLFYVAATRAKKGLYLLGHIKGVDAEGIHAASGSFLERICGLLSEDAIEKAVDDASGDEPYRVPALELKRLPLAWKSPVPGPEVCAAEGLKDRLVKDSPEFYWAGEAIRHTGSAVHRYLCRIAKQGLENWGAERIKKEKDRIAAMLRESGLNKAAAQRYSERGVEILLKAVGDERGRWILKSHEESAVELPVTGVVGKEILRAVIDRSFVEGGVRWVIDYKTGTHEGGSLEDFLENEKKRYGAQLERYAGILRASGEKREIRKGLYYPALCAWVEWRD